MRARSRRDHPSRAAHRPWHAVLLLALPILAGCGGGTAAPATPVPTIAIASTTAPAGRVEPTATAASLRHTQESALPLPPHGLRPTDVPAVVATVADKPVAIWLYLSQVNFRLALAESPPAPGQPAAVLSPAAVLQIERQSLAAVIENAVLVRYGEAHGWAPRTAEIRDAYMRVVQRRGGAAASMAQVAREYLTEAQDRSVARNRLVTEQVLAHFLDGLRQPAQAVSYRMIVTASRAEVQAVRARLAATSAWVDLSARYSLDVSGRRSGGEQPLLARGQGEAALEAVVFRLPPNRLSEPVRLAQGWAIVEVLRRFPDQSQLASDMQRYQAWVAALRHRARVTSYLTPAP